MVYGVWCMVKKGPSNVGKKSAGKKDQAKGTSKVQAKAKAKKEQAQPAEHHIFYCKHKESKAKGYFVEETKEFVILAGSELRSGIRPSLQPSIARKRERFIAEQCDIISGQAILRADYVASSPSIAGALVLGRNTNGWTKWRDADGKTLDEVYRKK